MSTTKDPQEDGLPRAPQSEAAASPDVTAQRDQLPRMTGSDALRREIGRTEAAAIPWGYGVDRVGAMAVDPERLFVYWEVTDESIERARSEAGPQAAQAPLVLRVYDTTGRIFDGTNAHGHFDHELDRSDRQWFFDIHKPASSAVVELGLRVDDDRWFRIARSRRVEFPPVEERPPSTPRWLTVRVHEGRPEPAPEAPPRAAASAGSRPQQGETTMNREPAVDPPLPVVLAGFAPYHEQTERNEPSEAWTEPRETWTEPEDVWAEREFPVEIRSEERRVVHREEPTGWNSWESGPFATELGGTEPWSERWEGETHVFSDGSGARMIHSPWEVAIRGIGAFRRRTVLSRWELHRSWVTEEGHDVVRTNVGDADPRTGSSERVGRGASERRWLAGSELRLSGSSELLYLGASERRFRGASERILRGASERLRRGASERLVRGASERLLGGASEKAPRGASERRLGGASEQRPLSTGRRTYPAVEGRLDDE